MQAATKGQRALINYPDGAAPTIDPNIGQYDHRFTFPYRGRCGAGASVNRFVPSQGNHDWRASGARLYLEYFTLPGSARYYDFTTPAEILRAVYLEE